MIPLLKLKDAILQFVGRFELYVMAAYRFVVGYVAFHLIITYIGYMDILGEYPFPLLLALLCCFLPSGVMVFCAAVLILLELYALSPLLCLIVALVFMIMFCAYMRFANRKGMYVVLTPIMSVLGVPFTMPVASGLLGEPYSVISVICGEITYFILRHVTMSETLFLTDDVDTSAVITLAVTEILLDEEMYLYLIAFAAAAIVTFCIRKLAVRQSFLIAAAIGIVVQIAVIGGGEIMLGRTQTSLTPILIGCVVSFLILMILIFFTHGVNYRRVENVQFEDDDYYYYVRAIPKSFLPRRKKKKKTQKGSPDETDLPDLSAVVAAAAADALSAQGDSNAENSAEGEDGSGTEKQKEAATQLAAEAVEQAAAAEAAERAAAEAVAERAAAAAQAISEAAGQAVTGSTGQTEEE